MQAFKKYFMFGEGRQPFSRSKLRSSRGRISIVNLLPDFGKIYPEISCF